MRGLFTEDFKAVPILSQLASVAATDRSSEVIDCKGIKQLVIALHLGVVHNSATQSSYLQHSDAVTNETTLNGGGTIEGSKVVHGASDDNTVILYNVVPKMRYLQLIIDKDTSNAGCECATAYLCHNDERPVTQSLGTSTVGEGTGSVATKLVLNPVTGTP